MKLSEFDLQYHLRQAIKSQILIDFIAECTLPEEELEVRQDTSIEELDKELTSKIPSWTLYIDGSFTSSVSGTRIILVSLKDATLEYALWFSFSASNNETKYEALITGLKIAKELKVSAL